MSDELTALGLLLLGFTGLYAYGVVLLQRMGREVQRRGGRAAPPIHSPLSAAWLVAAYRAQWERDDELPRLHRSLRLCQALLLVVVLAAAGHVIRTAVG